jgi:diguanylate cyclase (GGDEF)-like protein/PAS domain S-box-containing protein
MDFSQEKSLAQDKALLGEALAVLSQCRYFETMTSELLGEVLRTGTYLEAPPETLLIRESSLDDDIFFLLEGSLKIASGEKLVLRLNTPGDIVGEFAVVSDQPRSADVYTEVRSRLVRIASGVIKEARSDPGRTIQFLTLFAHIMAAKLRETSRRARLYEDAVLEAREFASSNTRLETEIADKLQEILLYSKVIESSSEAMVITDKKGRIERFNPAAARMFSALSRRRGKSGQLLEELVHGFDQGAYPQQRPGTAWHGEWLRGPTEDPFVLQVTVTPVLAADEAVVGVAYQLRDISLQKAQERSIAKKNEEIQKTLLDLEATYQELQRGDRLKTETLTVISNELSGPIRKIMNHTGKLVQVLGELTPAQTAEELAAIQEQGEYLKIISDNISYLIDVQSEVLQSGAQSLVLQEVISQVCKDLGFWAARKSIAFDVKLPEDAITMAGDPEQVKVALKLLLEQALMVSNPQTVLTVEGHLLRQSEQVHIEIAYEGPSFHHIGPGDTDKQGRMGLLIGLPLARKVISQYQGSLQFLGTHQQARISILLPRVQREGEERPNRVMVFDEQDMDRMIVQGVVEHLWPDSVIMTSHDPFELLDNYEDFKPDLVILDPSVSQPGWSNHRLVAALVQNRRHVCPVFSLSTLYRDFAERTIAVERGVTDFLAKPYSIFDLRFKIKSLLQSHRKEESLHQNMDQAQRQAYTDGLTRLANRKHFDGFLETQINYSLQTRKPCSLILLDIDNFKHYNDTNGHQLGDEILKGVSRVLAKSVRSSDLAARYGGEEFVIVLPETGKEMAAVIAEKVRRSIQDSGLPKAEKQPLGVISASFGVATFDEDADSAEKLIGAADQSLYLAKEQGRNRVVRAQPRAGAAAAPQTVTPTA